MMRKKREVNFRLITEIAASKQKPTNGVSEVFGDFLLTSVEPLAKSKTRALFSNALKAN